MRPFAATDVEDETNEANCLPRISCGDLRANILQRHRWNIFGRSVLYFATLGKRAAEWCDNVSRGRMPKHSPIKSI